ncbi:MAG: NifB/NifX family molybdenum-iron cluster-binding protein [Thermoproteota archaeon]
MTKLKVAVSSSGPDLDARVDPRFGRCQCFLIVDTDTMSFEVISNSSAGAMSGAGIQAAQEVVNRGVGAVITGSVGPNAYQVLSSAGIRIFVGAFGTVRDAVGRFKRGELSEATTSGPAGMGMGRGMRRGRWMDMGRGMWGRQMTSFPQGQAFMPLMPTPMSREQEISLLEEQMRGLQQQLDQIKRRIGELKGSSSS